MPTEDVLDQARYREARMDEYVSHAARAGRMSRRCFLQTLALTAGLGSPVGEILVRSLAAESPIACGDARGVRPSPGCPGDRLITKPTPEERFRLLAAGSAEMRWDRVDAGEYLTATKDFYVHNRSRPPRFDPATWRLTVEGNALRRSLTFTYDEITNLPSTKIVRVLDCAANGRAFFANDHYRNPPTPFAPSPVGSWRLGAVGAAEWRGVSFGELLERTGLLRSGGKPVARDLQVESIEVLNGVAVNRVVSIEKALEGDSLLVYQMNGEPLPLDHGAPVRALFSGWAGIANVKWVRRILVSKEPIFSTWNAHNAVLVGPDYEPGWRAFLAEHGNAAADALRHFWGAPVRSQNIKSAFELAWGAQLARGRQTLRGRSWSGTGLIREVTVSVDGGRRWSAVRLIEPNVALSWVRWEFEWDAQPGDHLLIARARDSAGHTQVAVLRPEDMPSFNKFGLMFGDLKGSADSHNAIPHPVSVR